MSFHTTAVGTAAECAAQLASQETDNVLGARLAETLVELLGDPAAQPDAFAGGEYRYVVKLSGHSGKKDLIYLTASVEAHFIPPVVAEVAKAIEAEDQAARDEAALDSGLEPDPDDED